MSKVDASLMLMHEPLIHLAAEKLECKLVVSQEELDGIYALLTWLDGYTSAGSEGVPGHYELLMVYRRLRHSAAQQPKAFKKFLDG